MSIRIPEDWRKAVAPILHQGLDGTIQMPREARRRWLNLDTKHYDQALYSLLAHELEKPGDIYGKNHTMNEEGECYSFSFRYHPPSANGPIDLYTKLNLLPDGQVVIIYSAHP
jgi:hypothetical protein